MNPWGYELLTRLSQPIMVSAFWQYVRHNWALISIAITLTSMAVMTMLILRKYVRIMFNIIRDTPPPLSMNPRDFERLEGEPVQFRAFDNLSLTGMFVRGKHDGTSKGMIIFAHEFSSDRFSCARYCRPLIEAGFDIFSFDFRGHGDSSSEPGYQCRQWPTEREVNDMQGAIAFVEDWLESRGRPVELGVFGISRGAGAAILASLNNPAVKAIITDGVYSTDAAVEYFAERWAYIFAKVRFVYENHPPQFWMLLRWLLFKECKRKLNLTFPSVRKMLKRASGRKPILFIHGERDSYIPKEQSKLLYDCAPGPKTLWIVPKAKHNQSVAVAPQEYAARTVAFFEQYLAHSPRPANEEEVLREPERQLGAMGTLRRLAQHAWTGTRLVVNSLRLLVDWLPVSDRSSRTRSSGDRPRGADITR